MSTYEWAIRVLAGIGTFSFIMTVFWVLSIIHDKYPGTDVCDKDDHS